MNSDRFLKSQMWNLRKIKGRLMVQWNSLIIRKEIKNHSCRLLRRLKTNEHWNILRKFLNLHMRISIGNWFFKPIFYSIFQEHCHLVQLWKTRRFFYNNFFGFGGREASPSPCGRNGESFEFCSLGGEAPPHDGSLGTRRAGAPKSPPHVDNLSKILAKMKGNLQSYANFK